MALTPSVTYVAQYGDAISQVFIQKVTMAMCKAANAIAAEAVPDPITQAALYAQWQRRQSLVRSIAVDEVGWGQRFAFLCASLLNNATGTDPGDYDTAVASVFNTAAGKN